MEGIQANEYRVYFGASLFVDKIKPPRIPDVSLIIKRTPQITRRDWSPHTEGTTGCLVIIINYLFKRGLGSQVIVFR